MKKITVLYFFLLLLILLNLIGCVPPKYFTEVETEKNNCKNVRDELLSENEKLTVDNIELKAKIELAEEAQNRIEASGQENAEELKNLKNKFNQLSDRYDELQKSYQAFIGGSDTETRNLMERLENTQRDLYQHEDQLNQLSVKLNKEREELILLKKELELRNTSLIKLQSVLARKDSIVDALKQKVTAALMGFENQGLTITKKNGKVYISLEEKLLFASGSTEVDARGINALRKLAVVLEQNPEINITIEGHTDDVPVVPGAKFADNWDLSVQRATTIIRILLDGSKINPKRLTASGRGEYQPVDLRKTPDARQKNRRTEIILTPKLDELFSILEQSGN
jgi:chemotaxis protein MotB